MWMSLVFFFNDTATTEICTLSLHDALPIRQSRPDLGYLWVLLALAFPAVFINLGHGQNGLLTAALLGAALLMLTRQPLLSGTLFGLLAYKPQFALVIPIALLASNQWRAIAAAAATIMALSVLSVAT